MRPEDLRELIDARRPGTDDHRQLEGLRPLVEHLEAHPEDRSRLDRVEQFDLRVQKAIRQTPPVPEGLEARLLARCLAAQSGTSENASPGENVVAVVPASPSPTRGRWLRRSVLALAACAVLGLSWMAWQYLQRPDDSLLTAESVAAAGQTAYLQQLAVENIDWQPLETAPTDLQPASEVRPRSLDAWRHEVDFLGRTAVAYRVSDSRDGLQGILIVAPLYDRPRLATTAGRMSGTGGFYSTSWHRDGHLYVLVLQGPPGMLERQNAPILLPPRGVASVTWPEASARHS
jgi:hypothetical protein